MKTTIENLAFPSDIKKRLKMKVSTTNLNIEFLSGHIIKFNQTNISVREPHRIIVSNFKNTLIILKNIFQKLKTILVILLNLTKKL